VPGLGQGAGEMQEDGVARLHVAGAAAVEELAVAAAREVVGDGDGVEVAGEQHPPFAVQVGAGEHGVALAPHLEVGQRTEGGLHGVGESALVPGDARHVDEGRGEGDGVGGEVEGRGGGHAGTLPPFVHTAVRVALRTRAQLPSREEPQRPDQRDSGRWCSSRGLALGSAVAQ
jgi:hypothetical protein